MSYFFLIFAFLFNSLANILLKIGSKDGIILESFKNSFNPFVLIKDNIYLFLGLAFFAVNVIFYFLALKNVPVSLAYPVMVTMSLLLIGGYAFLFAGEHFTYYHAIGYALIITGIVVTFMGTK